MYQKFDLFPMFRIIIILLTLTLDLIFGDPPNRFHPLILMGRWLSFGRRLVGDSKLTTRNRFWFGTFWTLAGIGLFTLPFQMFKKQKPSPGATKRYSAKLHPASLRLHSGQVFILHPLLLKPILAYRGLRQAVKAVAQALTNNDLAEARQRLSWHLVSRDTSNLNKNEVVGATIESLAENLTDSVTAPLLAYAVGGLPAAWAYRFINTADAMWGYRTPEFEQLGKFPARLDDALNWLPARLTGWLLIAAAWLGGGDGRHAARTMLAQHHQTASPNAGWTISAMAGALHVTLSKQDVYELTGGQETLDVNTIKRALRLADICVTLVIVMIGAILMTTRTLSAMWRKNND
jgi:adenosylcobinamide-phosphate synthase